MARDKGQKTFASNYEVKIAEMLDPRLLVDSKEELIKKETWPSDGDTLYMKEGMFVYVKGDGFYELVSLANILATDYSGWKKVTSGDENNETDYYEIATFCIDDLRNADGDFSIDDTDGLLEALSKKKRILIKDTYESSSSIVVNCYKEDVIYCSILTEKDIIYFEIEGDTVYYGTISVFSLSDLQPKLVSGTNIKTINGESVLGSGNIYFPTPLHKKTLSGGGTHSLSWQNYYYFSTAISSDTIFSLPRPILMDGDPTANDVTDYLNEILIEFTYTSGSISFTQTGAKIIWQNGTTPTFTAGNSYQISIVNNLACFAEFKTT